ncbi:hypothetical protein PM082_023707 [Marasmius tenuissimus]|nr:hypothetical protein PM082_023707 [Marasmius tenuissimus]
MVLLSKAWRCEKISFFTTEGKSLKQLCRAIANFLGAWPKVDTPKLFDTVWATGDNEGAKGVSMCGSVPREYQF